MALTAAMKCNGCGHRTLMSDMRYSRYSDSLVCETCFAAHKSGSPRQSLQKISAAAKRLDEGLAKYKCSACGYRFARKQSIDFRGSCPYCSRDTAARILANEAQQIIRESQFIQYY